MQFSAVQVETKVQLNFTIKAGNTCNGIEIFRSPDSVNFSLIGDIQGVCGSTDRKGDNNFYESCKASKELKKPGKMGFSGFKRELIKFVNKY